jgi:hypothetical protein
MPYPRKVTDAQLARMEEIAKARLAIPEDKILAHEMGIPIRTLQRWLVLIRKRLHGSTIKRAKVPITEEEIERLRQLG